MPKEFANSQKIVEIDDIRQNTVILKNGGLRQILMVGGVNFALKSEDEQNAITAAYQNFLNSVEFPLQIVIHSRKININRYLKFLEKRMAEEPSELLKNQISEYKEFVRSFISENPIMSKTFLVVVPFYPTILPKKETIGRYIPFFKKDEKEAKKREGQEKEEDFRKNLQQLQQRTNQVIQGLQAIDLEIKPLEDNELIELFYNFYNPEAVEREGINIPQN